MHANPNPHPRVPLRSVTGLGICDALRIELRPVQVRWLIDELDETRGALEAERRVTAEADDRSALEYRLRLLGLIRSQLRITSASEPIAIVGPGPMMNDLVGGTMLHVVETLGELVHLPSVRNLDTQDRLEDAAEAVAAWIRTYRDCAAVEAFNVDPDADPTTP